MATMTAAEKKAAEKLAKEQAKELADKLAKEQAKEETEPIKTPQELMKDLVHLGEEFCSEWLDLSSQELMGILDSIKAKEEEKESFIALSNSLGHNGQVKQLLGLLLYNNPKTFDPSGNPKAYVTAICKIAVSPQFKTYINGKKGKNEIIQLMDDLKELTKRGK